MQSSPRTNDMSSLDLLSAPGVSEYSLMMTELDIQHIARLMREFVVMNLVPWMERCVVEWNENVRGSLILYVLSGFTLRYSFRQLVGFLPAYSLLLVVSLVLPLPRRPMQRMHRCHLLGLGVTWSRAHRARYPP